MIEVKSGMATKINGVLVEVLKPGLIQIESFTRKGVFYAVDLRERTCTCPDFHFRGRKCKHLKFAEEHEMMIRLEMAVWESNRKFEEWRKRQAPALAALLALNTFKGSVEYWRS